MRLCNVSGCDKKHYANGFCQKHYMRVRNHGRHDINKRTERISKKDRFLKKIKKTDSCWMWTGSLCHYGYGSMRGDHGTEKAHRVSYEVHIGPIPKGMGVLHRCDVPACVNPEHLFLGDQADNMRDMRDKGRGKTPTAGIKGDANGNHRLKSAQVIEIRKKLGEGQSGRELARYYGVSKTLIYFIRDRKVWTHI